MGLRSNVRIGGVENTKCRDRKHQVVGMEHPRLQVVDSCGLREFILVLEKDISRWVNVSRAIQKVRQWPTMTL